MLLQGRLSCSGCGTVGQTIACYSWELRVLKKSKRVQKRARWWPVIFKNFVSHDLQQTLISHPSTFKTLIFILIELSKVLKSFGPSSKTINYYYVVSGHLQPEVLYTLKIKLKPFYWEPLWFEKVKQITEPIWSNLTRNDAHFCLIRSFVNHLRVIR